MESQASARGIAAALAIALLVGGAQRAQAQTEPTELAAVPGRVSLGGELGYFTQSQVASNLHLVSARLSGRYAFDARWSVQLDLPAVLLDSIPDRGDSDVTVRPGNPTALGMLSGRLGAFDYTLGAGGAAPLAVIEREPEGAGRLQHTAYTRVQDMSGLADLWLWAPSRGALLLLARASVALGPLWRVSGEVEPALMIPAREEFAYGASVQLFVPVALAASLQLGAFTPGLRAQAVFMTTRPDALQLAYEPWLRLGLGTGFLEVRYTGCVGEPLGGKRGPGSWGLHLGGGGTL